MLDSDTCSSCSDFKRKHHRVVVQIRNIIRIRHLKTGIRFFIADVPVYIIGIFIELQCQFVVVVTLGIVVGSDIFAQHETINDVTVTHTPQNIGTVVSFHFNVCAIRFLVFVELSIRGVIQSRSIEYSVLVFVLTFVLSLALHIFVEIECIVHFAMCPLSILWLIFFVFHPRHRHTFILLINVIIWLTPRDTCRPMFVISYVFADIRNTFAIFYQISVIVNIIPWIFIDGTALA